MSRIKNFLKELDEYELAYFAKFKLQTFDPETQTEIKNYLLEKNLSEDKIEKRISTNPKKSSKRKIRCKRCSSDKIDSKKIEFKNDAHKIVKKDKFTCKVCGNNFEKSGTEKNKKSIWSNIADSIFDIFINS